MKHEIVQEKDGWHFAEIEEEESRERLLMTHLNNIPVGGKLTFHIEHPNGMMEIHLHQGDRHKGAYVDSRSEKAILAALGKICHSVDPEPFYVEAQ